MAARDEFLLDPDAAYLNHGAFGACPRPVFEEYQRWQLRLERQPTEFLEGVDRLLAEAAAPLASYLAAEPEDLVFVENATTGVNLAARALALGAGDEVVTTSLEHGACDLAWTHVLDAVGGRYVQAPVALPIATQEDVVDAVLGAVTERTRALFVSHVTSETALRLPLERLVAAARGRGLTTIVDGAHAPGQVPLDLGSLGADVYAGNCHKWLCAPKGAGFLWVRPELQERIHPAVVSWGYGGEATFRTRFEVGPTRDPAAYLAVPAALAWQRERDWDAERRRCRELALVARHALAEVTGEEPLAPEEMTAQMVSTRLPVGCDAELVKNLLWSESRIVVASWERRNGPLLRVSFQAYNDEGDLEALLEALPRLLDRATRRRSR